MARCPVKVQQYSNEASSHHPIIVYICIFFTISGVCAIAGCDLTCQNGGARNETTCTCDCADGYSGDTCESECPYCFGFKHML